MKLTPVQWKNLEGVFFETLPGILFWIGVAGCGFYGLLFIWGSVASGHPVWSVLMPWGSEFGLALVALVLSVTIPRRQAATVGLAVIAVPFAVSNWWRVERAVSGISPQMPIKVATYGLVVLETLVVLAFLAYSIKLYRAGKLN